MEPRWCLIVLICLAAACSSSRNNATPLPATSTTTRTTESAQQAADIACRNAAPHDFFNASSTTVGAIRAITGGGGLHVAPYGHPYASVLTSLKSEAFAAWCWRQPSPDVFVAYIVGP